MLVNGAYTLLLQKSTQCELAWKRRIGLRVLRRLALYLPSVPLHASPGIEKVISDCQSVDSSSWGDAESTSLQQSLEMLHLWLMLCPAESKHGPNLLKTGQKGENLALKAGFAPKVVRAEDKIADEPPKTLVTIR